MNSEVYIQVDATGLSSWNKKKMCPEILQKMTAICFESKVHCFGESFWVQALSADPPTLAMRYLKKSQETLDIKAVIN